MSVKRLLALVLGLAVVYVVAYAVPSAGGVVYHGGIVPNPYSGNADAGVPVNNTPPTISGSTIQGNTLSDANGSWTNAPPSYS